MEAAQDARALEEEAEREKESGGGKYASKGAVRKSRMQSRRHRWRCRMVGRCKLKALEPGMFSGDECFHTLLSTFNMCPYSMELDAQFEWSKVGRFTLVHPSPHLSST